MVLTTDEALREPAAALRLDLAALSQWLAAKVPDFPAGTALTARQFSHGQSNPTYLLQGGGRRWVLRKKPPGRVLPSAHAVEREYAVLAALAPTRVPVPAPLALCQDASVLGTPFYVMAHVQGRIFEDPGLAELAPAQRRAAYTALARTLAALHAVQPGEVGLQRFGRATGYCARQVWRWKQQYLAQVRGQPLGDMLRLVAWLEAHVPASDSDPAVTRISHGDFRLDNLVFDAREPGRVLAVLDWELATLGHPLADLAYSAMAYHLPGSAGVALPALPTPLPEGIPSEAEYVAMYCAAAGAAAPAPGEWAFALALSLFRAAAILAGVGARAAQGNASSARAGQVGSQEVVAAIVCRALAIAEGAEPSGVPAAVSTLSDVLAVYQAGSGASQAADGPGAGMSGALGGFVQPQAADIIQGGNGVSSSKAAQSPTCGSKCPHCAGGATCSTCPHCQASRKASGSASAACAASSGCACGPASGVARAGFDPPPHVAALVSRVERFLEAHVLPAEPVLERHSASAERWTIHPLVEQLKARAKAEGLWNLWLPADLAARLTHLLPAGPAAAPAMPPAACSSADGGESAVARAAAAAGYPLLGVGLSNLEYAHVCEVLGRSVWAPEIFNSSAPDTGNMEVLARYGTPEQQQQWLVPLLEGRSRSCFAMTEPAVASSDATNIRASIRRESDSYVINAHKWWASGAPDPRCRLAILMGKTDPTAATHRQQSMVLVPMDTPGVKVVRPLLVFGTEDAPHGHAEMLFQDVRVPVANMLLGEGRGFEIAQGRLGPGRLHHCMRLIGAGERAVRLMAQRGLTRTAFGRPLAQHGAFAAQLAGARVELDAARLVVLAAAHALDQRGNKAARGVIAAAKVIAPNAALRVIDAAIQAHGGAGVSEDTPLARLWVNARTLRIADGPDDVHLASIAKLELTAARARL